MTQITLSKTNCYYLENEYGNLLIDTGYAHDKDLFLKQLGEAGIAIEDIRYLLLTHHHDDHCGLVSFLVEENPDLVVIMHSLCAHLVSKGYNAREYGGRWCSRRMQTLTSAYKKFDKNWTLTFPPYFAGPHDLLLDFSRGSVPFLDYTILSTPGHTPDSISLLSHDGSLFIGDGAANFLQFAGTHYAPPFITDINRFYETWKELLTLPIARIYPAHGKSFSPEKLKKHLGALKESKMPLFAWD